MIKEKLNKEIEIPKGITLSFENNIMTAKGPKGEVKKKLLHPMIDIIIKENKLTITTKKNSKREKKILFTFNAHIKNMIKGASEGFNYKLKICSGHFPMNVTVSKTEVIVKNFLGGKVPKVLKIKEGATVKMNGTEITVDSLNKEIAGQVAADIEKICRITNKDRRIFQDGIYIVNKAGKEII